MNEIDLDKCDLTIFSTPFVAGWFLLGVSLVITSLVSCGDYTLPSTLPPLFSWDRLKICVAGGAIITGVIYYFNEVRR
jgi:hypothetical protein